MTSNVAKLTVAGTAWMGVALTGAAAQQVLPGAYNWTGFYVGGNLGAGIPNDDKNRLFFPNTVGPDATFVGSTPTFFGATGTFLPYPTSLGRADAVIAGGAQAGYNYQVGALVYGLEVDYSAFGRSRLATGFGRLSVTDTSKFGTSTNSSQSISVRAGLDSLTTIRGRIGYAFDNLLVFGTVGLAIGDARISTAASAAQTGTTSFFGFPIGSFSDAAVWAGKKSDVRTGVTFGGGVEYGITPNWTVKAEALYYDLGTIRTVARGTGLTSANGGPASIMTVQPYIASRSLEGVVARVGVNYRF